MMSDKDNDSIIPYDKMVETALRAVIRDALEYAKAHGLPGNHHYYITFRTDHPGVRVPTYLSERYPDEITIVLQHQFWGLETFDHGFQVSLSFDNVPEQLEIPFGAVTVFGDPSVNFVLQFKPEYGEEDGGGGGVIQELRLGGDEVEDRKAKAGQVVELDAWRRK